MPVLTIKLGKSQLSETAEIRSACYAARGSELKKRTVELFVLLNSKTNMDSKKGEQGVSIPVREITK